MNVTVIENKRNTVSFDSIKKHGYCLVNGVLSIKVTPTCYRTVYDYGFKTIDSFDSVVRVKVTVTFERI